MMLSIKSDETGRIVEAVQGDGMLLGGTIIDKPPEDFDLMHMEEYKYIDGELIKAD